MASQTFIIEAEQKIIETIEAVKYEATVAEDNFRVSPHNYDTWFSLMENTELLLNELKKYVKPLASTSTKLQQKRAQEILKNLKTKDEFKPCQNCKVEHRTLRHCEGCNQEICLGCFDDHNEVEKNG